MSRALPSPSPVDAVPPADLWFLLAIQQVLVMYAGAVAVPLVVAGADTAFLLSAELFCCGLPTPVQPDPDRARLRKPRAFPFAVGCF